MTLEEAVEEITDHISWYVSMNANEEELAEASNVLEDFFVNVVWKDDE